MDYIRRQLGAIARKSLARGKSILLLGPRQTGKTTFVRVELKPDLEFSFVKQSTRLRYERAPVLFEQEIAEYLTKCNKPPTIFIDEIQKIPAIMDSIQYFIDKQQAKFILTGSSARKLKHGKDINLLPGRVVSLYLSPFTYQELPANQHDLTKLLLFGTLPGIILEPDDANKELDLSSYITTYLEDEIRSEAVVKNIGAFSHFLQFAAGESGKQINLTKISQEVGVAASTIAGYFQILLDCLITFKIDPIINSTTNRRLIKSPKYLFFDLGIRRACANEGTKLPERLLGELFEQFVGVQLKSYASIKNSTLKLKYWRDSAGPKIDYVLDINQTYIPIEVKWTDKPSTNDTRHLEKFMAEYDNAPMAYIVCRTPNEYVLGKNKNIKVIPWQKIHELI